MSGHGALAQPRVIILVDIALPLYGRKGIDNAQIGREPSGVTEVHLLSMNQGMTEYQHLAGTRVHWLDRASNGWFQLFGRIEKAKLVLPGSLFYIWICALRCRERPLRTNVRTGQNP